VAYTVEQWTYARGLYEVDNLNLIEVSKKTGISYSSVEKKARKEAWGKRREQNNKRIEKKIASQIKYVTTQKINKVAEEKIKEIENIADETIETNRYHLQVWQKLLKEVDRHITTTSLEPKDIAHLATALDKAQKGQRLAEEKTTENTKISLDVDQKTLGLINRIKSKLSGDVKT